MKPEHFIYKSDGLYYMQNVPKEPEYPIEYGAQSTAHGDDVRREWEAYFEALERAKAEAVTFNDYFLGLKRILHSMNISCGEGNEELVRAAKSHLKEGVYTINMEEKIEVVRLPCGCGGDICECNNQPISRIVAPKKVELPWNVGDEGELYYDPILNRYRGGLLVTEKLGQETVGHVWRDVYYQISGMLKAGKNVYEITEVLQSKFEIKRKPL